MRGIARLTVVRLTGERREFVDDDVIVEEPLEVRISGETLAVTMRTPGHDRELALGLLFAEGILSSIDDVSSVVHCGKVGDPAREGTIDVTLAPGVKPPIDPETGMLARRGTLTTSACGVCGRQSIDDLLARVARLPDGPAFELSVVHEAMRRLKERQPLFRRTGGCHGASLVSLDGTPIATFEDVGRHNAVDKVIGSRLLERALPLAECILLVSGRASFEIVQKALVAGISVVASVSAPSSLAAELAAQSNLTLLGFVRDDAGTLYTGAHRIK